ncbi:MAG TPA: hypothetical protein VFU86_00815 [Terriglobales bacterium]|nr:hypothetical protein [Terriglobales bacterium]
MGRATKYILIVLLTFTLFAAAQTVSAPSSPQHRGTNAAGETIFLAPAPFAPRTPQPWTTAKDTAKRELNIAGFKFQRPDLADIDQDDSNLPPASSPLPLISVIGFGVLVGGVISAMKTRS